MKVLLALQLIFASQLAFAQAVNGTSTFNSDGFGPPDLSISGATAKGLYSYLRSTEEDGPDIGTTSKIGNGVTCYRFVASDTYRCDFIVDTGGIIGGN